MAVELSGYTARQGDIIVPTERALELVRKCKLEYWHEFQEACVKIVAWLAEAKSNGQSIEIQEFDAMDRCELERPMLDHSVFPPRPEFRHSNRSVSPHARFRLPEDAWIFDALSEIHTDYLVGGSISDHLHLRPEDPMSFKDVDLSVGLKFVEAARTMYPDLARILESKQLPDSSFDEVGVHSLPRSLQKIRGVECPAKFWIFIRGVPIDTFVVDLDRVPSTSVDAWGRRFKLISPEHRIKMLESILEIKWAKKKTPSLEVRIGMLKALVRSYSSDAH
jgi:hypothetical protein